MGSINIFKLLSTFLYVAPLSNLSNMDNVSTEFFLLGIDTRAAASGSKHANHCAMLPPYLTNYGAMAVEKQSPISPNAQGVVRWQQAVVAQR